MECGKQVARIVDYGLTENKSSGGHSVFIKFSINGETITWWGSLKEGIAAEITTRSLIEAGYQGEEIKELNLGVQSDILNADDDINVVVAEKANGTGVLVKYVKFIGDAKEVPRMNEDKLKQMSVNHVAAIFQKLSSNTPIKVRIKKPKTQHVAVQAPEEEIPF